MTARNRYDVVADQYHANYQKCLKTQDFFIVIATMCWRLCNNKALRCFGG
jgi:hypothetical protein